MYPSPNNVVTTISESENSNEFSFSARHLSYIKYTETLFRMYRSTVLNPVVVLCYFSGLPTQCEVRSYLALHIDHPLDKSLTCNNTEGVGKEIKHQCT